MSIYLSIELCGIYLYKNFYYKSLNIQYSQNFERIIELYIYVCIILQVFILKINEIMASKNTRIYNHEEYEAEMQKIQDQKGEYENPAVKKSKHSLDSDEEDEEETAKKYNVLDPNDIEGK